MHFLKIFKALNVIAHVFHDFNLAIILIFLLFRALAYTTLDK